jgi:hypothetical protein
MAECWNCGEEIMEDEADVIVRACNPHWAKFPYEGLCIECCLGPGTVVPFLAPNGQA